jgi:hypothetical protein
MHPFVQFRKASNPNDPEIIRTDRIERVTIERIEQVPPTDEDGQAEAEPEIVAVTAVHLVGKSHPVLVEEGPMEALAKWRVALVGPIPVDG